MNIFDQTIIPLKGFCDIDLSMPLQEVVQYLRENKIAYRIDKCPNKGCDPEVEWNIVRIGKDISIYFAGNTMFEIWFEHEYKGKLPNGICLGMAIDEAKKIDGTLLFNDDYEVYESSQAYWVEDSLVSGKIEAIAIFIKEVLDDDLFYSYSWAK